MSDKTENFSFTSFWKSNSPTRNVFFAILIGYIIASIISIARGGVGNFLDIFVISEDTLAIIGQSNDMVYNGHIYQLVTSVFVHVHILHFLSNCLFLFIFGLRAEERIIDSHYYIIFLISGILGSLLTLSFGPGTLSAGASGGIFGLLGVDLVLAYEETKRRSLWSYLGAGAIFLILSGGLNVNFLAHSIGFISGVLLPLFVFKKRKQRETEN